MVKNILIKYDISGDFQENQFYTIKFDYNKSSLVPYIELEYYLQHQRLLETIHETEIEMQYRGISKVDEKKLFIIDAIQLNRKIQIQKLDF